MLFCFPVINFFRHNYMVRIACVHRHEKKQKKTQSHCLSLTTLARQNSTHNTMK